MPVMKANAMLHLRESAIVMDLSDLEREAAQIVAKARTEAMRLMTQARADAERETIRLREQARQAGHAEGLQAGMTEGRQKGHDEIVAQLAVQLKELTGRWSQTLELLHQHFPAHIADAKTDLIRLAVAIAERVTHQEALRNRNVAPAVVEETLRAVGAARRVILQVSPAEIDMLEHYLPDLLAKLRLVEEVELTADETVGPGGCVLRFGGGTVDARIETQLRRIAAELLGTDTTAADSTNIAGGASPAGDTQTPPAS